MVTITSTNHPDPDSIRERYVGEDLLEWKSFRWHGPRGKLSMDLPIPLPLLDYVRERPTPIGLGDAYVRMARDPLSRWLMQRYLRRLERADLSSGRTWDMDELVRRVATFVQSLRYRKVQTATMTPLEMLYHGCGVCRDSSVLAASFFHAMGYPVVYIRTPGHILVGIANAGTFSGKHVVYEGRKYYWLETTTEIAIGWGDDKPVNDIIPVPTGPRGTS